MKLPNNLLADFIAFGAGLLFTLAFAPFEQAYLAVIGLALLFWSWQQGSAARGWLRGYLFGLGSFGLGVSWVFISIHDFGGGGIIGASLLTALFVGFWALFPALAGYWTVKWHPARPAFSWLAVALIWTLVEYLRGIIVLNGFPWLLAGYAQLDSPLAGYIPLSGAYGSGFLTALSAALLVRLARSTSRQRIRLLAMLGSIWLGGALLNNLSWTAAAGPAFKIAMIQGNITQDQKWRPENRLATLKKYQILTEQHWGMPVIIWPESAIPAYLAEVYEPFLVPLQTAALRHGTDLIVSVPIYEASEQKKYNAVLVLGNRPGTYRKNHLLPFGEYLPLQPVSGYLLGLFKMRLGIFQPGGAQQPLLQAAGYPFSTSICYEDAFGIPLPPAAAYLVNVTNDAWFGNSIEPHQHLQLARMRALETGRFLLRATNTGLTAIIGPNGKILEQVPGFTTTVLTGTVTPMTGLTPYSTLGDKAIGSALAGLYLIVLLHQVFRLNAAIRQE